MRGSRGVKKEKKWQSLISEESHVDGSNGGSGSKVHSKNEGSLDANNRRETRATSFSITSSVSRASKYWGNLKPRRPSIFRPSNHYVARKFPNQALAPTSSKLLNQSKLPNTGQPSKTETVPSFHVELKESDL